MLDFLREMCCGVGEELRRRVERVNPTDYAPESWR